MICQYLVFAKLYRCYGSVPMAMPCSGSVAGPINPSVTRETQTLCNWCPALQGPPARQSSCSRTACCCSVHPATGKHTWGFRPMLPDTAYSRGSPQATRQGARGRACLVLPQTQASGCMGGIRKNIRGSPPSNSNSSMPHAGGAVRLASDWPTRRASPPPRAESHARCRIPCAV